MILEKLADRIDGESVIFKFFKLHTMEIYLIHQQIIYFVLNAGNGKINGYMLAIICFAVAISISSVITIALNRSKLTRYLITGKRDIIMHG